MDSEAHCYKGFGNPQCILYIFIHWDAIRTQIPVTTKSIIFLVRIHPINWEGEHPNIYIYVFTSCNIFYHKIKNM